MAADAVNKIRETEEQGRLAVRRAADEAKQIVAAAGKEADERRQAILRDAASQRDSMIQEARNKAQQTCKTIEDEGNADRQKLLSPDPDKLDSAVKFVMERIVSVRGNR